MKATKARSKVESGAATRRKLIDAAEKLFSEKGFDAVSVRDITEEAGANVAAVNYHFNNRDHLVDLVMERYINPVNEERLARLEALESKRGKKGLVLEEILDAFVRPFATQVRRSELSEKMFYKLMGRVLGDRGATLPPSVELGFQTMLGRFVQAIGNTLPGIEREDLLWRIHFMVGSMIHAMAHGETLNRFSHGMSGMPTMEQTLARFVAYSAAGMRQSVAEATPRPASPEKTDPPQSSHPEEGFLF